MQPASTTPAATPRHRTQAVSRSSSTGTTMEGARREPRRAATLRASIAVASSARAASEHDTPTSTKRDAVSRTTLSYLPATVTTRSPRFHQHAPHLAAADMSTMASAPATPSGSGSHLKRGFHDGATPLRRTLSSSPATTSDAGRLQLTRSRTLSLATTATASQLQAVGQSSSTPPNRSQTVSTTSSRALSRLSSVDMPPSTPVSHTRHAKFVYANGKEEVLSPRKPGGKQQYDALLPSQLQQQHAPPVVVTTTSPPLPQIHFYSTSPTTTTSSSSSLSSVSETSSSSTGGSEYTATDTAVEHNTEDDYHDADKTPRAEADILIPSADASSALEPMTDAARTNRKILDLEISNTSLLAVNRTLEREISAQSRDLRKLMQWIRRNHGSTADILAMGAEAETGEDSEHELELTTIPDGLGMPSPSRTQTSVQSTRASSPASETTRLSSSIAAASSDDELVSTERELIALSLALDCSISRCISRSDALLREARIALTAIVVKVQEEVDDVTADGSKMARVLRYYDDVAPVNEQESEDGEEDFEESEENTPPEDTVERNEYIEPQFNVDVD
ncbi:uncharacterized protein V1518DRAFT_414546 [Limtongia smithiae]|uniref:uncharacterized protein n=1 Tax=Limtongia smithiae TaxID=1125753 RepID=UPI0034CD1E15